MAYTLAHTHNSALKKLLAADLDTLNRTALEYSAKLAVMEKEAKLLQNRCAMLEKRCNEQEQIITRLRA